MIAQKCLPVNSSLFIVGAGYEQGVWRLRTRNQLDKSFPRCIIKDNLRDDLKILRSEVKVLAGGKTSPFDKKKGGDEAHEPAILTKWRGRLSANLKPIVTA
jgi:hypothetical protein